MLATPQTLLSAVTTTGASDSVRPRSHMKTFVASGLVSASTGSATVLIQGSMEESVWVTLGTISLTLGTALTAGLVENEYPWPYVRANVTAITGTNAAVTVKLAI